MNSRVRGRKQIVLVGIFGMPFFAACARVDPSADFERTRRELADRTQSDDAYDPGLDAAVAERVSQLLVGGLTVDRAVSIALLNNRAFQASFYAIGASRADVVQSTLLSNPSLFFGASFPEGGGRTKLTMSFAQELVDLWQIPVRKKAAEAQLERTIDDVLRQGVELATDVRTRFYRLAALEASTRIARENVDLVQETIDVADRRLQAGEANALDVNLARASLLDVKTSLIELQRDRDTARLDLSRALALSRGPSKWTLADNPQADPISLPVHDESLVLFAMQERFDARMAVENVTVAEKDLKRQWLNVFPSVSLGVEGERSERRALPGRKLVADTARASIRQGKLTAPDIQTKAERDLERRQIIDFVLGPSMTVTLPIWDQNQAQIAKARFELERRHKEFEDTLDQISDEVMRAAATARASVELKQFYETEGLPTAESGLQLARKAYQAGEQNIIAVIESQKVLIAQRLAIVNVERDYRTALAELRRALGGRFPAADADADEQPSTSQPAETGDER